MPECIICGGTEFYAEAGFYFCKECQTQNQEIREEVLELRVDPTTRVRKIRIRQDKSNTSEQNLGWTSWEQHNFILIGMTNELVELGASPEIKMTILQLWALYLGKLEVAFTSTKKKSVPRLARIFYKRDAEIIYGKITRRRRNRKCATSTNTSASSMVSGLQSEGSSSRDINKQKKRMVAAEYERFVQSQDSSEGEALSVTNQSLFSVQSSAGRSSGRTEDSVKFNKAARRESKKMKVLSMKLPRPHRVKYRQKHTTTQYKIGPQVITPMKLWSLIYLALRIHDESIHLADMLRYAREGHLSYYRLDHLLPPEVTLTRKETNLLHQNKEITHKGVRQSVATMAKFLKVWETKRPNLMSLIERYCIELQLPKGIAIYAERMMAMSPPRMPFDTKTACFPKYEGRAMAFIIVVLKILFGLDGSTEYEISRVVEKINTAASSRAILGSKLFSFCEWQRYVEARRNLLTNIHFPTKLKRDPEASGNSHLYLKFLATIRAKSSDREEPVIESYKHLIPRELTDAMKKIIGKLDENALTVRNDTEIFAPSLTPQYSYLQQLLEHPERDLPSDLRADFYSTKVGHMTKPKALQALAARCNVNLGIADTGIHFLEKVVSTFKQSNLPSIQEFNRSVQVEKPVAVRTRSDTLTRQSCDDLEEYLHRKNPGSLFVDRSKLNVYDAVRKAHSRRRNDTTTDNSYDDFGFDEVLPSGKLLIRNDDDSEDESARGSMSKSADQTGRIGDSPVHSTIDFLAKYNLSLSNCEKNSLAGTLSSHCTRPRLGKTKRKTSRDPVSGKFVSPCTEISEGTKPAVSTIRSRRDFGSSRQVDGADRSATPNALDSSYDFGLDEDDISILHDNCFESVNTNDTGEESTLSNESETLFRPYSDYWMLRCNFSRVKQKNFRDLEKNLPSNFRWLLEECSSVIEMTEEDLYEEVCLVETYYSDVLRPTNCPLTENRYNDEEYRSKADCNAVKKKW